MPINIAIEKLRGFVTDQDARIIYTKEDSAELEVSSHKVSKDRRKGDHQIVFRVELKFSELRIERTNNVGLAAGEYSQTKVEVKIWPKRSKPRRKADTAERARLLMQNLKAYLMAHEGEQVTAEFIPTVSSV